MGQRRGKRDIELLKWKQFAGFEICFWMTWVVMGRRNDKMCLCVCACVRARARACVCVREREREDDRPRDMPPEVTLPS